MALSEQLIEVHQGLRERLARLRQQAAAAGPETLRRELGGLTAILESHFGFEERRLATALDALGPDARFPGVCTLDPPE